MGPKTPVRIEEKVLRHWLSGISRQEISEKVGVSVGTILTAVKEAKKNVPDIVLLRELAVKIRKKGWNLDVFSSAVRHRSILFNRSLTDEQIDDLIEEIDEHCFKKGISVPSFLNLLHTVSLTSALYGVPVEGLDELISEKEGRVMGLENNIADLVESYSEMLKRYNTTEQEIEQNQKDRPLIEKIKELRDILYDRSLDKMRRRNRVVLGGMPEGKSYEMIFEASLLLLYNSSQLEKEIDYILEREPSLPNKLSQEEIDEQYLH